jgi:hypothetical protein
VGGVCSAHTVGVETREQVEQLPPLHFEAALVDEVVERLLRHEPRALAVEQAERQLVVEQFERVLDGEEFPHSAHKAAPQLVVRAQLPLAVGKGPTHVAKEDVLRTVRLLFRKSRISWYQNRPKDFSSSCFLSARLAGAPLPGKIS